MKIFWRRHWRRQLPRRVMLAVGGGDLDLMALLTVSMRMWCCCRVVAYCRHLTAATLMAAAGIFAASFDVCQPDSVRTHI